MLSYYFVTIRYLAAIINAAPPATAGASPPPRRTPKGRKQNSIRNKLIKPNIII